MNLDGVDFLFQKANGDAEWWGVASLKQFMNKNMQNYLRKNVTTIHPRRSPSGTDLK